MAKTPKIEQVAKDTGLMEARSQTDTIRLWENYRDQAAMWRALALFQIPATFLLIVFSTVLWATRSITLNVPARPLPGQYLAKEIPDSEFVETATNFINLIASYQPYVARRQFERAREMLAGPVVETFDRDMLSTELQAIETTTRSQIYFIDPVKTKLFRINDREVSIVFEGDRDKFVAGKELPLQQTRFTVTLGTVPRNGLNPYGIVITDVRFENIERR